MDKFILGFTVGVASLIFLAVLATIYCLLFRKDLIISNDDDPDYEFLSDMEDFKEI